MPTDYDKWAAFQVSDSSDDEPVRLPAAVPPPATHRASSPSTSTIATLAADALCLLCADDPDADAMAKRVGKLAPRRELLSDALLAHKVTLSEETLKAVDQVLDAEAKPKGWALEPSPVAHRGLGVETLWYVAPPTTMLGIWRGDIRNLKVDAVVNAAIEGGLGCFIPRQSCLDNVLHRAAGPRLRAECRAKMAARGSPLSAGSAPMLTKGYHLHAAHVLHVTGPQLQPARRQPSAAERAQLEACYTGCLEVGIRSVAFPCISAGLFGYPHKEAARAALTAVTGWLKANKSRAEGKLDVVLMVTFADNDAYAYMAVLEKWHPFVDAKEEPRKEERLQAVLATEEARRGVELPMRRALHALRHAQAVRPRPRLTWRPLLT